MSFQSFISTNWINQHLTNQRSKVLHLKCLHFSTFLNHLTVLVNIPKSQKEQNTVFTLSTANTMLAESMRQWSIVEKMLKYTVRNLIHLLCMNWSCLILQGSANSPRQLILSFKYVTNLEEWLLYVIPYHHSRYSSISWVLQLLERH